MSENSRQSSASPASSGRPSSESARRSSVLKTPPSATGPGRRSSDAPSTMR